MSNVRLHPRTKAALEYLGGQDYTMDEVVNMLLNDFIDTTDEDDEDENQLSLFDFDEDDE